MSAFMLKLIKPTCSFLSYHLHQDEAWSEARYFSAAKMAELHDEQKPEPAEPPSAERREQALAFARQAIEASLALADRMEAA